LGLFAPFLQRLVNLNWVQPQTGGEIKEWVAVGAGKANWVELAKEAGNSRRVGQKAVRGDSDRIKVTDHHLNFQKLENVDGWTFEWGRQRKRSSLLNGASPRPQMPNCVASSAANRRFLEGSSKCGIEIQAMKSTPIKKERIPMALSSREGCALRSFWQMFFCTGN
jgi:hypothetical protein